MKKIISIGLVLAMTASLLVLPTAAATESEMIQTVQALGIMVGDENGNMNLDDSVTRAQFATMSVRATPGGDSLSQTAYAPFPDVPATHWSAAYVTVAVQSGYIVGYTDGTFQPDNQISLAEGLTMVLKILGYSSEYFTGTYPQAQMLLADQLGLCDDVTATLSTDILDRGDAMTIFYNALTAKTSAGQVYLTTLGYTLDSKGEVDLTALINATMDGPIVAEGSWTDKVSVDFASATITKDGKAISASQISTYDVVYWNEYLNTVWVYSDRVTGSIQAISPSTAAPTSVMVAGQSYALGSSAATYAFSQLGEYSVGDSVTLLLGRDDSVIGVTDVTTSSVDKVGMVTAIQKSSYDSGAYTADTITILATDGKYYSYPVATSYFDEGDLARVTTLSSGTISVTRPSNVGLSGAVAADGSSLGKVDFASNVEILDIYGDGVLAMSVYTSRLAGVTLDKSDILYSETNDDGELTRLVLNNVTGDLHSYAVVTDVVSASYGTTLTTYYYITMGEVDTVLSVSGSRYTTQNGPALILGTTSNVAGVSPLNQVSLSYTSGQYGYDDSTSYRLADDVQVYEKDGSDYFVTTLDRADEAGLSLTAYYDSLPADGGLVRIIIAG